MSDKSDALSKCGILIDIEYNLITINTDIKNLVLNCIYLEVLNWNKMSNEHKVTSKLEGYIKSIIDKEGYIKYKVDIKNLSLSGHYFGQLYLVDVNGQTLDGDNEINLFVKQIVHDKNEIKMFNVSDIYHKEYFAYTELFKVFNELQDEVNLPVNNRFITAINYDAFTSETIILENLTKRDFSTNHGMVVPSLKYTELCMEQLAKFHSFTFVIQARRPDFFDKIKIMKQPYNFGDDWNSFVKNLINITIANLDDDIRSKMAHKILDIVNKFPLYMNDTTTVCTLCHGDYKQSNVMVKEKNGEASEVIPVDFQLLHYGSPILDILNFIFSSTDHEFRESHLKHLKNLYYQNLKSFLEHFQIDIESVYPRGDYERDFNNKLDFGMMKNVCTLPFIFATDDGIPIINEELSKVSFKVDRRFRDRIRGAVDDFIKWGYL